MLNPLFPLGLMCITPMAKEQLQALNLDYQVLLHRHQRGDWGDLDSDDLDANEEALHTGSRIFSAYLLGDTKFWCITEADRSSTTILLPSEY
jgi:hypothetical protein